MKVITIFIQDNDIATSEKVINWLLNDTSIKYEIKEGVVTTGEGENEKPFTMPFGKHLGKSMDQVPTDYFEYLLKGYTENKEKQANGDKKAFVLRPDTLKVFKAEIKKRGITSYEHLE